MRHAILLTLATTGLALGSAAQAAPATQLSWGKPGISLDEYRRDAVKCGRAGYYADVSHTEAAQVFKRATSELSNNEQNMFGQSPQALMQMITTSAHIVEGTRPDLRYKQVKAYLEDAMNTCLRALGYRQFRLTPAQQHQLRKLHLGSPERHAYLYSLASDPAVLQDQAA